MAERRLLDQVRDRIRFKHYSLRTEHAYVQWIRRFILFYDKRHPRELSAKEIERYLTHLAVSGRVSASTQNQAKSALLFLYKEVLAVSLPWMDNIESAKRSQRVPVVLTRNEVQRMLAHTQATAGLILRLVYGTGLRIMECLRLRVKDIDFARGEIVVREGKGSKDRITMLLQSLNAALQEHLQRVRLLHAADLKAGHGDVSAPRPVAACGPRSAAGPPVSLTRPKL